MNAFNFEIRCKHIDTTYMIKCVSRFSKRSGYVSVNFSLQNLTYSLHDKQPAPRPGRAISLRHDHAKRWFWHRVQKVRIERV
jgi:hypothetical protein